LSIAQIICVEYKESNNNEISRKSARPDRRLRLAVKCFFGVVNDGFIVVVHSVGLNAFKV